MSSVIFKTHPNHVGGVVKHEKHALHVRPNLAPGDTILIARTQQSLARCEKPIVYLMTFVNIYSDRNLESDQIFGRHWPYIIEGKSLRKLRRPFNIVELQVSSKNYRQGGPFVHVDPRDEDVLRKLGYFESDNEQNLPK